MNKTTNSIDYNKQALLYAERYGIINYKLHKNTMIYRENFMLEHCSYKCIVDLNIMQEKRIQLKRFYKNN